MNTTEKIENLTWFSSIEKQKAILLELLTEIEQLKTRVTELENQ